MIQYWQQSWPETPPKMPSKEDQEDDPWQGQWVTAVTDAKSTGNIQVFTFKPMTALENPNAGYLPGSITYRRTLKVRLVYPGKHQAIQSLNVFSVSGVKSSSVRIELVDSKKSNTAIEGSVEIFNGAIKNISSWHWDGKDKKTGSKSFRFYLNGKPKGIIANIGCAAESLPGSNDETVITFRAITGTLGSGGMAADRSINVPMKHGLSARSAICL